MKEWIVHLKGPQNNRKGVNYLVITYLINYNPTIKVTFKIYG